MRIIGGGFKGRRIIFPKSPHIRPTQDKIREALFNVIAPDINGAAVLDLFAGSGALGLEAISRGATHVTFVDNNSLCIRVIKENLDSLGATDRADVFKTDVIRAIEKIHRSGNKFDIVFLDPPYYKGLAKKILIKLSHYDILAHNNIIVAEHYKKDLIPDNINKIILLFKQKKFGDTVLSFYKKT